MDLEEPGISWLCTVYEVRFCNLNPVIGLVFIFLLSVSWPGHMPVPFLENARHTPRCTPNPYIHPFIVCLNVLAPKWDSPVFLPKMTSSYIQVLLPLFKQPFAIFLPSISLYFGEPSSHNGKQKPYFRLGIPPCLV